MEWPSYVFGGMGALGVSAAWWRREKDSIIKDIKSIIAACRSRPSFDDRSESKLLQWLEGPEDMLHRKSLWRLHHIKQEMFRYLDIHMKMDIDQDLL